MTRGLSVFALLTMGFAQVQQDKNIAPAPSDRFPASWYPPDSDVTYTAAPQTGAPYSGTMVTTFAGMSFSQSTFQTRDSAGRMRTETNMPRLSADGGGPSGVIQAREVEISDPVSHCSFVWTEPWLGSADPVATVTCMPRTLRYAKGGLGSDAMRTKVTEEHPYPHQVRLTEPLGERSFGDVKASGVRVTITTTNPATNDLKTLVSELWYSAELKESIALRPGIGSGVPSFELTNVHRGESDPTLFYPPTGYKIRPLGSN